MTSFARGLRSFVVGILLLPLLGAASAFGPPVVVVYPLTAASGATDNAAGGNIALLLSTKLAQLGGISVKPYTPGTDRPHFLDAATAVGADYYVTGFLTPVGAELSMITQVVSTHSGSVVYSTTVVARTYADAVGQADVLREAILRHAGRGLAALDAPPPAPTSSPAAVVNESGVNITKALKRRQKATPSPAAVVASAGTRAPAAPSMNGTATPAGRGGATPDARPAVSPVAVALAGRTPNWGALLFTVGGDLDVAQRTYATTSFANALRRDGLVAGVVPVSSDQGLAHPADICKANGGARELYAAALIVGHDDANAPRVQFDVSSYDCSGSPLLKQRFVTTSSARDGTNVAIDRATAEAAERFAKRGKTR